jgi:hypothetical protein
MTYLSGRAEQAPRTLLVLRGLDGRRVIAQLVLPFGAVAITSATISCLLGLIAVIVHEAAATDRLLYFASLVITGIYWGSLNYLVWGALSLFIYALAAETPEVNLQVSKSAGLRNGWNDRRNLPYGHLVVGALLRSRGAIR